MNVEWIILADAAEVINGKVYALGAGWDVINLAAPLPAPHRFSIVIAFQVPWNETNQQHEIEIELLNPDGKQLVIIQGQLEVGRPPGINHGSSQRVPVAFSVEAEFDQVGPYALFARVDGELGTDHDRNKKQEFQVSAPAMPFPGLPAPDPAGP